jgi:bacterioferritin-associated ferredoxin
VTRRQSSKTLQPSGVDNALLRRSSDGAALSPRASHRFARNFTAVPASVPLQRKLKVGSPGDAYELEADRVADRVMRAPADEVQRSCGCGGSCGSCDDERMQRKHAPNAAELSDAPGIVEEVLGTAGRPLDAGVRAWMEPRFGHDFTGVRVHAGTDAAASAEAVGARAYTVGRHIVFGAGEYQPGTAAGQRLLAHELTHVAQQDTRFREARVQRDDASSKAPPKPKAGTAAAAPHLNFMPAKNPPPCACLVFMHHDEANARLMARLMYEFCRYNLAIVEGGTPGVRRIKLGGTGTKDPNELFPKDVAEQCWNDDQPCLDFLENKGKSSKQADIEDYAERQFFLSIKHCSNGFTLPVVGLHNNSVDDTERYRKALAAKKLDPAKISGKTFDESITAVDPARPNVLPFTELETWLEKLEGVKKKATIPDPANPKATLRTPPIAKDTAGNAKPELLTSGKTNIFIWCSSHDNTLCHIGNPARPDDVVWVTNADDFDKLSSTTANVALQTRDNDTDLSTLFVKLPKISEEFELFRKKLEADVPLEESALLTAIGNLLHLWLAKGLFSDESQRQFGAVVHQALDFLGHSAELMRARGVTLIKPSNLHFTNVEAPQVVTVAGMSKSDLRLESFKALQTTLDALGINCCATTPATGETESTTDKVKSWLGKGTLPPAPKKAKTK